MSTERLTDDELDALTTSPWDAAREAVRAGDADAALAAIDDAQARATGLQRYSIEWIASLLTHVGRAHGEAAVEEALRASGEQLVRPRRGDPDRWWGASAARRARAVAQPMVANGATVEVSEDDEKITLAFHCGSGGRLIDEGRYGEDGFLVLRERGPMTFDRDELPVYCAHCSIHNELQPMEWNGRPTTVEHTPRGPGEPCVHHVYRTAEDIPDEIYVRLGRRPPTPFSG